jgi:purine-binding chemotaxis protein CheW
MLQNSAHDAPGRREVVSFKVAEQDFCIDIGVVREIRGWTPTTVLPHAQDYVKGVVNLRGSVVAVVDLVGKIGVRSHRASGTPHNHHRDDRRPDDRSLADVVSDILTIDDTSMRQVPDIASEVARDFISSVVTFEDGRMLRKIDLSRVLPELGVELA